MRMNDDAANPPLLEVSSLRKEYRQPDGSVLEALRLDSLRGHRGEAIALTGPSGSGKTTLLHMLAALIPPTSGSIVFDGRNLDSLGTSEARWRAVNVGYVFQESNLLPDFNLLENLLIAAEISGVPSDAARERAASLLCRLGLEGRIGGRPRQLSTGEQQRAAVARAVLHNPPLVLANEPTANLDAESSGVVMNILAELCSESRSLLLVATHDEAVRKLLPRVVALRQPEMIKED
jgi:ABC-type lipoprotein export system ATPase subunit